MTPFQALYGRVPPSIVPYPPGSSKVAAIDELLVERNVLLRQLKENLFAARNRMEMQANRVGEKRFSNKLSKRYYGSFEILERVGKVAYQLGLPPTSKIHPFFHVSLLKPFIEEVIVGVANLSEEDREGRPVDQPLAVCATLDILHNRETSLQILVQWRDCSPDEATWEDLFEFQSTYPSYDIEDKVNFEGEKSVTPVLQQEGRPIRTKSMP
ncbi:ty3-gypsy retrotransposon protein, partial [Tanacetum coccineum]